MSSKKQTAVEWLEEQRKWSVITNEHIEQAKAMEKEQIIEAYKIGYDEGLQIITKYENVEDYYTSTYK